jgi:hypothetical protein
VSRIANDGPVKLTIYRRVEQVLYGVDSKPEVLVRRRFIHEGLAIRYMTKWVTSFQGFILPDADIEYLYRVTDSGEYEPQEVTK